MCGLVGAAGDVSGKWKDVVEDLLVIDSLRGMHSTGVAAVARWKEDIVLLKTPGGPSNLLMSKEFSDVRTTPVKLMLGHNRLATVGAHTVDNAHPFLFEKVVGAHNGTLDSSDRKKLYKADEYGTDSEALYSNMNMFGLESTIEKLSSYSSAWALTWFNREDNTINFLRNNKRPLVYAYSKDRCTLVWASEQAFIEFAVARNNVDLHCDENGLPVFYAPVADTHYSWEVPKNMNGKFGVPRQVEVKAPPPPPVVHSVRHYRNGSWFEGSADASGGDDKLPFPTTGGTSNSATTPVFRGRKLDTKKWRPPYRDSQGHILNKVQRDALVEQGCVYCGETNINWGQFMMPFKSGGTKEYDFLCEACYNDDEVFDLCKSMI